MTDNYAVLGNPIEHSLSPEIHKAFAKSTQQDLLYKKVLVPLDDFKDVVLTLKMEGFKGLNITLPFKEQAFELCTKLSPRAVKAHAVNTISFSDKTILGDNTDGIGLVKAIEQDLKFKLFNKSILLIGAGGAAKGVVGPLLEAKPKLLTITNRTSDKAAFLAQQYSDGSKNLINAKSFDELIKPFDCIINATSLGLAKASFPLSHSIIHEKTLCYDLVYGKETSFLQWAKKYNAGQVADGLTMLVEQAAEAFFIWRGIYPETQSVIQEFQMNK